MQMFDVAVLAIVLISALMGLVRGITRELLSILAWLGATLTTYLTLPLVQHLARQQIANPMMADGITAVVVFIVFLILFSLVSHFFSGVVRQSALGGIDRSLGFGFGIVRGAFLICLLEITLGSFVNRHNQPEAIKNSRFISLIYQGSDIIFPLMPKSLQDFITKHQQKHGPNADGNGEGIITSPLENAVGQLVENQIKQGITQAIPLNPSLAVPSPAKNPVDSQKAAEELAHLKPKAAPLSPEASPNYSKKQRLDMERLLEQEETDG